MYSGNELVGYLGKSVNDADIAKLLGMMGHTKPVKKPKRGENSVNVEHFERGIGLVFHLAETLPDAVGGQFPEGELVLKTIFLRPTVDPDAVIYSDLPWSLIYSMTRTDTKTLLGEPEWISNFMAAERWSKDGKKLHIVYGENEASIFRIGVFLPDA